MRAKPAAYAVTIVAGLLLVGCDSTRVRMQMGPPIGASRVKCTSATCPPVRLTVDNCAITISSDVIDTADGPSNLSLQWEIASDGYEFSKDPQKPAVSIKTGYPDGTFQNLKIQGTKASLDFKKNVPHTSYLYGLNVVRTSDKFRCDALDPWVIE